MPRHSWFRRQNRGTRIALWTGVAVFFMVLRILTFPIGGHVPDERASKQDGHYDYQGVIHFSGNVAPAIASAHGTDFLISTAEDLSDEGWQENTLFLHSKEFIRPDGYLVALNARRASKANSTSKIIADMAADGALLFIGRPNDWKGDDDSRIAGKEIIGLTDQIESASRGAWLTAMLYYPFNLAAAAMAIYHTPVAILRAWDEEIARRPLIGIYGTDYSGVLASSGDILPIVRDHILTTKPFSTDTAVDKALVHDAIRKGHLYIGVDALADTTGFFFTGRQGDRTAWMGDTLPGHQTEFTVTAPPAAKELKNVTIIVYRNGSEIARSAQPQAQFKQSTSGAYRAEVRADIPTFWGIPRTVGWIYSNPIYLK